MYNSNKKFDGGSRTQSAIVLIQPPEMAETITKPGKHSPGGCTIYALGELPSTGDISVIPCYTDMINAYDMVRPIILGMRTYLTVAAERHAGIRRNRQSIGVILTGALRDFSVN